MADTIVASGLTVAQWDSKFFTEYLTENRFEGEMGTEVGDIIQLKEDLSKKPGDRVHFSLVNRLTQDAITGRDVLEGNEERMDTRSFPLTVDKRRNGVRIAEIDEQYSAIDLRNAAKSVLKDWSLKDTETLIIKALGSKNGVNYEDASEAQKDAWLVDNRDRAYFASGYAGTDHSAGLTEQDATNDLLTPGDITAMKFQAIARARPRIRPVRMEANGRRYYVLYVHPLAFRDLAANAELVQAQREVALEMENNRLFKGGDLLWNGVIIKQIEEMYDDTGMTLTGTGAGGTVTVVPAFMVGAQAIGAAYAKRWTSKEETFDYGDKRGVAIEAIYGIEKMIFGSSSSSDTGDTKDHGVLTGYFASSTAT
jgi:N4-gp56 family major capsid protein